MAFILIHFIFHTFSFSEDTIKTAYHYFGYYLENLQDLFEQREQRDKDRNVNTMRNEDYA